MITYLLFILTKKKENIINVALKLFAKYGYTNTATSKIAKESGVSEGLIFRHFKSKNGLLDAIVDLGLKDAEEFLIQINKIQEPSKVLSIALNLPKYLLGKQHEYWKLHHSLKYQSPEIAEKYKGSDLFMQLTNIIEKAFEGLKYEQPKEEAGLFLLIISGLFSYLLNGQLEAYDQLRSFISSKYNL